MPAKSRKAKAQTQRKAIPRKAAMPKGNRRNAVPGLLSSLGGLAGNYLGGPLGGAAGMAAGKILSQITGFGDYKVNTNTVVAGNSVASFRQGGDGVTICHREFLKDIVGSVDFELQDFPINPGLLTTFPWLSQVAVNFEEFEMMGLVFEYRPSSGSAISSTSSALGVVIMATDYDVLNPLFATKQQMESYEYSNSMVPFQVCMHPVECKRNVNVLNNLYVREGPVPASADQRFYDMGRFQIATQGMQSAYVVGELWVSYDVRLRKPRLPASTPSAYAHLEGFPFGTVSEEEPFGSGGGRFTPTSNLPGLVLETNATLRFERIGLYLLSIVFSDPSGIFVDFKSNVGDNIVPGPPTFFGEFEDDVLIVNSVSSAFSLITSIEVLENGNTARNEIQFLLDMKTEVSGNIDIMIFPVPNVSPPRPRLRRVPTQDRTVLSYTVSEFEKVRGSAPSCQATIKRPLVTR